ncbi:MAG TPA: hypothetical protein VK752_01675 [Bryobacteraceae bacterium]|jgi:hypothetical protein|nr:hypothetical protein [Bryobacteraceae bacterium]
MAKRFLMLVLVLASFAAVAPAQVYGRGYGYARPGVRVGVYAAPRYYYGPRVYAAPYVAPYVAPVYPAYGYGYGYGYGYRGYAPRYYGGGYYRGGYARGYRR